MYKDAELPQLNIITFGGFDIKAEGQSLLDDSGRSYKILELLKYFVTFRGKRLLPETIIENLQPDNEYQDPKNVLRTQIFRLRKALKMLAPGKDTSKYFNIIFSHGYYMFELGNLSVLDADEFEKLLSDANQIKDIQQDDAIDFYKKAISLYAGQYLAECSASVWTVHYMNMDRRIVFVGLIHILTPPFLHLLMICFT
ncbi:MAG TPA: hypothetical protein GX505_13920 [Clostridiales bacterium]|nr:hypothetical protein [Clostridiales bacterium]